LEVFTSSRSVLFAATLKSYQILCRIVKRYFFNFSRPGKQPFPATLKSYQKTFNVVKRYF